MVAEALPPADVRVPPWDESAEAAVCSGMLVNAREVAPACERVGLRPEHFYAERHRRIYEACCEVWKTGAPLDVVTAATYLRNNDRLAQVGGMPYLTTVLNAAPAVTPRSAEQYARTVVTAYTRRQIILACQNVQARGYIGKEDTADLLRDLGETVARIDKQQAAFSGAPVDFAFGPELAVPLGDVPWICQSLKLAPGAPTMFAGYGYSRKTLAAQDLAVAVSSGSLVWSTFGCKRGVVRHLDYEQGEALTRDRYQRLARAHGREVAALGRDLGAKSYPPFYLDGPEAEDMLLRICENVLLCIIDSLRASCPSIDENSSEVRRPLDMLARVSDKTGAMFLLIHHARKPSRDEAGAADDRKYDIRGSSALFDACQAAFVFSGRRDEPTRVTHEKERVTGQTCEDFGIMSGDLPDPVASVMQPRWGLRIDHFTKAQLQSGALKSKIASDNTRARMTFEAIKDATLAFVRSVPLANTRRIRASVKGSNDLVAEALEELVREGKVRRNDAGSGREVTYSPTTQTNGASPPAPTEVESRELSLPLAGVSAPQKEVPEDDTA